MNAIDLARSASSDSSPPLGLSTIGMILWFAKAGRWDEAHDRCQEAEGPAGFWLHAYLHREEGDLANAAYWYSQARKPMPPADVSLADEWREITTSLLSS
jgi:hypothetical protein